MSVGDKIKQLRQDRKMTQRTLAKGIHLSNSYIGDLESGRTNPSIKTLETIAEFFDVDTSYFFDRPCCYEVVRRGESLEYVCVDPYCKTCPIKEMAKQKTDKKK